MGPAAMAFTAAGCLLLAGLAQAQTALNRNAPVNPASPAPGSPVDLNVGDADPLSVSLRRVETGNAQFSVEGRLTVADFGNRWAPSRDPATGLLHVQGYEYRAPGVRALIDRPTYLTRTIDGVEVNVQPDAGGREVAIVPANTVYLLTPERPRRPDVEAAAPPPPPANLLDTRINPQPALRIDPQVPARRDRPAPPPMTADAFFPSVAVDVQTTDVAEWVVEVEYPPPSGVER